jgi:hypothetical protein
VAQIHHQSLRQPAKFLVRPKFRSKFNMRTTRFATLALLGVSIATIVIAQEHEPSMHQHDHGMSMAGPTQMHGVDPITDARQIVYFPMELRERTLANMRDHLLSLQQIHEALSALDYDRAAEIAERRLGMSSMGLHGAHEVAKYMPQGMQDAGTAMHRSASRFAAAAQESAVTGDIKPALVALSRLSGACVSCHAGYRVADLR